MENKEMSNVNEIKQTDAVCKICRADIKNLCTAAKVSHFRKHVKNGMLEEKTNGKIYWIIVNKGKQTQDKTPKTWVKHITSAIDWSKYNNNKVIAKIDSHKNILIKCAKCGKYNKVREFCDDRFTVAICCNSTSLLSKRCINKLMQSQK